MHRHSVTRRARRLASAAAIAGTTVWACAQAAPASAAADVAAPGNSPPAASPAPSSAPQQQPASPEAQSASSEAQGGTITGIVLVLAPGGGPPPAPGTAAARPTGTPLPGVSVTATNTLTGKRYTAATDVTGTFRMAIPRNGRYVLRAEFAAFAPATAEAVLNATNHAATATLPMELASRAAARAATSGDASNALQALGTQALGRGLQALSASGGLGDSADASTGSGSSGAALPSLGGAAAGATGADAVAVNGQAGQTNGLAGLNEEDVRDRIESTIADARRGGGAQGDIANAVVGLIGGLIGGGGPGGGPGFGGGGRGPGGFGGGGAFRNFNPTQIHGNFFYAGGNAALDATQFSLTGNAFKPAYNTNRFGGSLAGSPYLPGLTKPSSKQFVFLNVNGQRNSNPVNLYGTVPTAAERAGDFSGLTAPVNGVPALIPIYDPATGRTFANNTLTAIDPRAQALLPYLPLPNSVTASNGTAQVYNYQRVSTAGQNALSIASRYVRNFGATGGGPFGGFGGGRAGSGGSQSNALRMNFNTGLNYTHNASDLLGLAAPFDGKTKTDGYNLSAAFSIGKGRLNHNSAVSWNRFSTLTTNLYTGTALDPGGGLGIPRPTGLAPGFYNGIPTLALSNFSSFSDTNPANRVQQTISFSDSLRWNRKRHNYSFGGDIRRIENNNIAGTNVLGQFTFTGYATQAPGAGTGTNPGGTGQSGSGSSFADFLLGAPQQSKIQAGLYKSYLRETVFDLYAQDDFRVRPGLTLNFGMRYEYFAPFTERNNRLVNLDHNGDFTSVAAVQPGARGPYSGAFPGSLVNPDRTLVSPRIGVAWRPQFVKQTVLRAGYGINYNTGQYGSFANSLSYQPPFAITQTNTALTQGCGGVGSFSLANAFNCTTTAVQNNFAINRFYRLGRVQAINAGIQHTFPLGIVFNADYNGSFGGNLDILRAPNRTASQLTTPGAQAFTYEDSLADSRFHALILNARKRLQKGIALQATYQYAHSIDNASSIGGTGNNTVAQNDARLDLEYGNSSFDLRHRLTGNYVLELPFGPNRHFLNKGGLASKALDGFSLSGDFTFATGTYTTPQYANNIAQVATGGNYTLRPDRDFTQSISGARTLHSWFNRSAFGAPINGFGTASRNSIELPGTAATNMSLSRTISFGDLRSFEARATASNIFNTVQYSGVNTFLDSATFGEITGTAAPRKLTVQARYRF